MSSALKIDKSVKDIVSKELKKVRQIVSTSTAWSLRKLGSYFPEKSNAIDIFESCFDILAVETDHFLNGVMPVDVEMNFEHLLLYEDLTIAQLVPKLSKVVKFNKSSLTHPELVALLIKKELEKQNEVPCFSTTSEFLLGPSLKRLKTFCALKGVLKKSKGVEKEEMVRWIQQATSVYEMSTKNREILSFFALSWFGCLCYGYHTAIRSKNWNLKLFILKYCRNLFQLKPLK